MAIGGLGLETVVAGIKVGVSRVWMMVGVDPVLVEPFQPIAVGDARRIGVIERAEAQPHHPLVLLETQLRGRGEPDAIRRPVVVVGLDILPEVSRILFAPHERRLCVLRTVPLDDVAGGQPPGERVRPGRFQSLAIRHARDV